MEYIYREIYLTENRRIEPIPVTENSKIPIHLKVMDVTLSGTTAQAYSYNSRAGLYKKNAQTCSVANNIVTLVPSTGFFSAGHDQLQIDFPISDGSYKTKEINVSCSPDFSNGGATPEAQDVVPLIRQAEQAATNAISSASEAANSASQAAGKVTEVNTAGANQINAITTKGVETLASIPADYSQLSESVTEISDTEKFKNLFDYRTAKANKFIDGNSEVVINGYYCSDFIEVEPSTWYCIPYTASEIGSYYNSSMAFVAKAKRSDYSQPSSEYSVFKTNATTKYIRVNGFNGTANSSVKVSPTKYMVIEGQVYPKRYKVFGENTLADAYKASNYLYGKTLLTYGDSITEGVAASTDTKTGYKNTYAGIVAKRNGMNFINLGWAGSTMADDDQKPFIHNGQIYSHFDNKLVTPDYITVWFGWNDYAHSGITLGTLGSEDESTFYGAYTKACDLLIKKFPRARIGLVVPYGMDADWRNAVRVIAKKFGLPYLDLYNNCPCIFNDEDGVVGSIADLRKEVFLADGTHPNDAGYEWLSTAYEAFLRRI